MGAKQQWKEADHRAPSGIAGNGTGLEACWLFLLALAARIPFLFLGLNNGTDAQVRYRLALAFLQHPTHLPSEVWLPMHFWLLSGALWFRPAEGTARVFTLMLGAATILPFWGIMQRAFSRTTALYSALAFALFGHHIGYSMSTSSEVPTIFFLVLGTYAWLRFRNHEGGRWLALAAVSFSVASLCRYEPWVYIPVLGLLTLDFSDGLNSAWGNRKAWREAAEFGLAASAGAIGWTAFSVMKWGHAFASAQATVALNLNPETMWQQPLWYRVVVVPGAMVLLLGPVLAGLALAGMVAAFARRSFPAWGMGLLALVLFSAHCFNSIRYHVTMSRYSLIYSWLVIPFAFAGIEAVRNRWPWAKTRAAPAVVLLSLVAWQAVVIAGAYLAPCGIADKLSVIVPTLPQPCEIRQLTRWLKQNRPPEAAIIVDDFNYEAGDIIRYSGTPLSEALRIAPEADRATRESQLARFVEDRRPRLVVVSSYGQLRTMWPVGRQPEVDVPGLGLRLRRRWAGENYQVYEIQYPAGTR